ncbi:tumor necrosis factor receptor superfamily member 1A isoform X1 [Ornithorhynchus anatinus]|uniref:tumor necrosis factor receptor superfamily member 1A isoform X1 n=1 Tax=Ornithorhynchus anatinus TaxID=9258 RepID=UPI0010A8BDD6|nr:tumor necrosis factor receptor superfamily member 1A isoform X1 [Ornithorhynchus anatinus]
MGRPGPSGPLMLLGLVLLLAGLPRPGAQVLETGLKCPKGKYPSGNNTFCCTKCHKGTYLVAKCPEPGRESNCQVCAQGTYTAIENFSNNCLSCQRCRKELGQVEKLPCTPDRNTECGCQENQYRLGRDHTFRCRNCSLCLNGSILHQCVENRDAVCLCNPGFFLKENKCYPCHHCEDDPDCKKFCPNSSSPIQGLEPDNSAVLMPLVIFLSLCCFFLVLVGLAWHFQPLKSKLTYLAVKRMPPTPREPTGVQIVSTPPSLSPASAPALVPSDWPPERVGRPPWSIEEVPPHPPASAATLTPALVQALPNCLNVLRPDNPAVLYAVVDGVPPSRWKEFMRRLGLTEYEIERLELQNGRCLREAHYSMLTTWRQRAPRNEATLELLGRTLTEMDLRGCLEDIQETLARGHAPYVPLSLPPR